MPDAPKTVRRCDTCPEDQEYLSDYIAHVGRLAGMTVEMFHDHPSMLLSLVFREMMVEQARGLLAKHDRIKAGLCTDNPGRPYSER